MSSTRKENSFGLKILKVSCRTSCEQPRLGLNQLSDGIGRLKIPLRDEDQYVDEPLLVFAFLCVCSGIFPERFRSVSIPVGSREILVHETKHPRCRTLSC